MNIEKEENIVVRYIPQYIVIETHYKPLVSTENNFSITTSNPKYDFDDEIQNPFEDSEIIEYTEDNESEESEENQNFDVKPVDIIDTKPTPLKPRYNSKAAKLLNDWFLNNLHNPYPSEKEKELLVLATNMTKLQVNYWFINKRKRNKHLINNLSKTPVDVELIENLDSDLSNAHNSNPDGTTVELEVTIQPNSVRKRRQRNMDSTENDSPAICDVCGKTFAHRYMLHSHLRRHDPSTWDECHICHKSFPDGLKRHMRVHSGERPYVCHLCGAAYKQAYGLTMHRAIHNDSGELYYCDTCNNGKGYRSKYALKDHLKLHYRIRNEDSTLTSLTSKWKAPKSCLICGFESYNLRSHMIARHSDLRPFKCEICSETFKFKKDLQTHNAYHSDEMNFKCDICDKRFKTKRKLVIHKRIHTTEKSHKCELCDKSFLVSTYLKKHMRLHTGEKKRHACTECAKDYSGITDLRRHLEREHGIVIPPNPKYSNNNMTKKHKFT